MGVWRDVILVVVTEGYLQPVGNHNFCCDLADIRLAGSPGLDSLALPITLIPLSFFWHRGNHGYLRKTLQIENLDSETVE